VYRDLSDPFIPNPSNRIATGVSSTNYLDVEYLGAGTEYYYIVHSVDSLGGEESNTTVAGGRLPPTPGSFAETFEPAGDPIQSGWVMNLVVPPGDSTNFWTADTTHPHSGTGARFDDNWPHDGTAHGRGSHAYESPMVTIQSTSVLTFWHIWSFENSYQGIPSYDCGGACYDGAVLEFRPSGGSWTRIAGADITGSTYNGLIDSGHLTDNPLGRDVPAWVGGTGTLPPYAQATVDIGAVAGVPSGGSLDIQLRWLQSGDTGNAGGGWIGWYLDDVQVTDALFGGSCTTFCTAPSAPVLDSADGTCSGIDLAWTPGAGHSLSFNVYRGDASGGPYAKINGFPVTGTTYTDTTAVYGNSYFYVVRAACDLNASFLSGDSNERFDSRLAPAPAVPAAPTFHSVRATSLTVQWSAAPRAAGYDLYRVSGGCTGSGGLLAADLSGTSYTDSGLGPSATYGYYLVAKNSCGDSASGSCEASTTAGPPPWTPNGISGTAIRSSKNSGDGTDLHVMWDASCGAADYELVYGTNAQLPADYSGVYGVSGVVCSVGNSGAIDWSGAPPPPAGGFLWFLVVATDGDRVEGPWGFNSGGVERKGPGFHGSSGNTSGCTRDEKLTTNPCGS
jgi:hypothetical protein